MRTVADATESVHAHPGPMLAISDPSCIDHCMNIQMNLFGTAWCLSTIAASCGAVGLLVVARRGVRKKWPTASRFLSAGALIELIGLIADPIVRLKLGGPAQHGDFGVTLTYMVLLDVWTVIVPLLHAAALTMIALGVSRMTKNV